MREDRQVKKKNRWVTSGFLSGWWDLNPRPRRPERRALAGLRHIPMRRDYNPPGGDFQDQAENWISERSLPAVLGGGRSVLVEEFPQQYTDHKTADVSPECHSTDVRPSEGHHALEELQHEPGA